MNGRIGKVAGDVRGFIDDLRRFRQNERERRAQSAMDLQRITALSPFVSPGGVGAELGVHKGLFSRALLDGFAPVKLYLIDPWYLQGTQWSWGRANRRVVDGLCNALHTMEDELASGRVELVIADDLEALSQMPDGHLDWAYLDTTHQYEHTVKELQLLKRKIKVGGLIVGDDWQPAPNHRHHGVYRAVHEFISQDRNRCSLLYADDQWLQWVIRSNPDSLGPQLPHSDLASDSPHEHQNWTQMACARLVFVVVAQPPADANHPRAAESPR